MAPAEADKPLCFAIMPISMPAEKLDDYGGQPDHFLYVAEHLFMPAAEAAGYEFRILAAHCQPTVPTSRRHTPMPGRNSKGSVLESGIQILARRGGTLSRDLPKRRG